MACDRSLFRPAPDIRFDAAAEYLFPRPTTHRWGSARRRSDGSCCRSGRSECHIAVRLPRATPFGRKERRQPLPADRRICTAVLQSFLEYACSEADVAIEKRYHHPCPPCDSMTGRSEARCDVSPPPFEKLAFAHYSARLPMLRFDLPQQNISFPVRCIAARWPRAVPSGRKVYRQPLPARRPKDLHGGLAITSGVCVLGSGCRD